MKAIIILATLTIVEKINPDEKYFTEKDHLYLRTACSIVIERTPNLQVIEYAVLKNGNLVLRFPDNTRKDIINYNANFIKRQLLSVNAKVGHIILTASYKKFEECCKKHS